MLDPHPCKLPELGAFPSLALGAFRAALLVPQVRRQGCFVCIVSCITQYFFCVFAPSLRFKADSSPQQPFSIHYSSFVVWAALMFIQS